MERARYEQLHRLVHGAQCILIAVHEHPDGDALGSMLALAEHLRLEGKQVIPFSVDPVPESFRFLPGSERVVQQPPSLTQVDAVVLLDCGDVRRTHLPLAGRTPRRPVILNLDHHPTVIELDGRPAVDENFVETRISSTCELVYDFLLANGQPVTKAIATCLLTGICTDTGNFQNLATTETCLVAASKLLLYGASLPQIIEATYKNKSVGALKLWGRALSRLKKDESTGQVTTVIRQVDLAECGVEAAATEGVSNFLNSLGEAQVVLVLREEDGTIRGSYRTTKPNVDVAKLARVYGGGGHTKAAGFTVKGRLEETPTGWRVIQD